MQKLLWVPFLLAFYRDVAADQLPILVDGRFDEWTTSPWVDPTGDEGSSGIDIVRVWAADDADQIFVSFELSAPILLNSGHDLTLYLDTDDVASTGLATAGIGAELEWRFGDRDGVAHVGGAAIDIHHEDIAFRAAPAVTSTRFELSIRRDATPGGVSLFSGNSVRLLVRDNSGGDQFPDASGGATIAMQTGGLPSGPELLLDRELADDIRLVTFNVLSDAPWEGGGAGIGRQLAAAAADVYCFQEIYDHTAGETEAFVASWIDAPSGSSWHSASNNDCKVVSRFPILDQWSLSGNLAVLLDTDGELAGPVLLVNAHLPCCGNDSGRQQEVDEILEFIRQQQSGAGAIAVDPDTAVVIVGDLNLVGDSQQLTSLLEGDIVDEGAFGPDVILDADGSGLTDPAPRQVAERMAYTWRSDTSSFWPGRLDYVIYSDSLLSVARNWVLYTPDMSTAALAAYGMQSDDSDASDHSLMAVDFRSNVGSPLPLFLRGDCAANQSVNLPDAVRILGVAFGEFAPACADACDTDDSGAIEITDAVYLLTYLFQAGPGPTPSVCAIDSTPDAIDCALTTCP